MTELNLFIYCRGLSGGWEDGEGSKGREPAAIPAPKISLFSRLDHPSVFSLNKGLY